MKRRFALVLACLAGMAWTGCETSDAGDTGGGDPGSGDPGVADIDVGRDVPLFADPGNPGDPGIADPGPSDPGPSDPGPSDPGPGDPGSDTDLPCDEPPGFADDCALVTQFQCGFMANCHEGVIEATWHHHWFCEGEENISEFWCSAACPYGCFEDLISYWPNDGAELIEAGCRQCAEPGDCEGRSHPECEGAWTCDDGRCAWKCDVAQPSPPARRKAADGGRAVARQGARRTRRVRTGGSASPARLRSAAGWPACRDARRPAAGARRTASRSRPSNRRMPGPGGGR